MRFLLRGEDNKKTQSSLHALHDYFITALLTNTYIRTITINKINLSEFQFIALKEGAQRL